MVLHRSEYKKLVKEIKTYVPSIKIKIDEDIIQSLGVGYEACYCEEDKTIYLKEPHKYKSASQLRRILFHELGHWACKPNKCGRVKKLTDQNKQFNYHLEEMIVDAVSLHFCVISGFRYNMKSHTNYIARWASMSGLNKTWTLELDHYFAAKVSKIINFIKNYKKTV